MAAGLSRKQRNSRVYSTLKSLQYKLQKAGVRSTYKRFQLFADTTGLNHLNGFNVSYRWIFASNGESAALARIQIEWDGVTELYGWNQPQGTFDAGIQRIIELFSRLAPEDRQ